MTILNAGKYISYIYIYVIKNYIIYTYMELQTNLYLEGPTVCNVNPAFKKKKTRLFTGIGGVS